MSREIDPRERFFEEWEASKIRTFETGATRDTAEGKPSYISYLSPIVLKSFGEYMLKHELQSNGEKREPGNWKKGLSVESYMQSLWRHMLDVWLHYEGDGDQAREPLEDALCAVIFNAQGFLDSVLRGRE